MQSCCAVLFCRKNAQIIIIIIISRSKMASSCLIYQTWWLLLVKLIAETQANTCLSCPILCSTTPSITCMSSAHRLYMRTHHLHTHVVCTSSVSTPHGQRGPKLSFYSDRNWLLNGICCKNVELFHFRIMYNDLWDNLYWLVFSACHIWTLFTCYLHM